MGCEVGSHATVFVPWARRRRSFGECDGTLAPCRIPLSGIACVCSAGVLTCVFGDVNALIRITAGGDTRATIGYRIRAGGQRDGRIADVIPRSLRGPTLLRNNVMLALQRAVLSVTETGVRLRKLPLKPA